MCPKCGSEMVGEDMNENSAMGGGFHLTLYTCTSCSYSFTSSW